MTGPAPVEETHSPSGFRDYLQPFPLTLGAMVLAAFAYVQYVTWTQFASNHVFLADVGVFDVIISGPLHGNFLRSPLAWDVEANYFAGHFRPILLLLTPFYLIHDGAMTYLTLQNIALVFAAIPLALYARNVLKDSPLALVVAGMYLSNHFVASIRMANHPEAFAPLFWFVMFLALERRWVWLYVIGFAGVVSIKEDMPLYLGAFGVALLFQRDGWLRRVGIGTIIAAILTFAFALLVMRLSGQEAFYDAGNKPIGRWESMGDTKGEILLFMLTHPHVILARLFRPVLFWLYASVGLLLLRDWRTAWLPLAGVGLFLIADDPMVADLHYYYSYGAIPFLFYGTVRGLRLLLDDFPAASDYTKTAFAGGLAILAAINAVLPTRTDGRHRVPFEVTDRHRFGAELIDYIPDEAPIAVQYDLFNRVPNRPVKLPMRLWALDHVEYVFLDLYGQAADLYGEEKREEAQELFGRLFSDEFEEVIGDRDDPDFTEGYLLLRHANTTE